MSNEVYANGNSVSCKAGDGKVIASMPDVCLSPPSPPAGPVPVPYPDTSFSKDMQNGSKTVMIGGQEVMLKDRSFFQTSPLGDEAATKGLGASVVTHVITGKTYFAAWSMDVQFEGANVDRNLDLMTSNHACQPGATPPMPEAEKVATPAAPPPEDLCPCCKKPRHANQKDPDTGKPYESVNEADWYQKGVEEAQKKVNDIPAFLASNPGFDATPKGLAAIQGAKDQLTQAQAAQATIQQARTKKPPCENLHDPPNTGCGTMMKKTNPKPKTGDSKVRNDLGFTEGVRNECIRRYKAMGRNLKSSSTVSHKTPLSAGGCPSDQNNLIPKDAMSPECLKVDDAQDFLQNKATQGWAK